MTKEPHVLHVQAPKYTPSHTTPSPGPVVLRRGEGKGGGAMWGGGGEGESVFHVGRASVWEDEKVLEMIMGMVAGQYECT